MKLPADLKPEQITIVCDTREPWPDHPWLAHMPLRVVRGGLATGDFTVQGLADQIAIERKTEGDLLACIGTERERFQRELDRMLAFPTRAVIAETTWEQLEAGEWRSRITSAQAIGSVLSWTAQGIPIVLAGTPERAAKCAARIMFIAARKRWRELRTLAGEIDVEPKPRKPRRARGAVAPETIHAFHVSDEEAAAVE